jgi:D-alanine-D-alanine ligase
LPLVVKPANRGSSVGVSIIDDWQKLPKAIQAAKKYSQKIIFQEYIKGREFTCGVIEKLTKIIPLAPTEIVPVGSPFFDYKAKYTTGASQEITPPNLSSLKIKEIQKIAVKVHKLIGCGGYSRTDMIMNEKGDFYVLEINTLPGMTETSIVPQGAKAAKITFPELLDIIVEAALI